MYQTYSLVLPQLALYYCKYGAVFYTYTPTKQRGILNGHHTPQTNRQLFIIIYLIYILSLYAIKYNIGIFYKYCTLKCTLLPNFVHNNVQSRRLKLIYYNKLFELLEEKGLNKHYLRKNGIHATTVDKLINNADVKMSTIDSICNLLKCKPQDILSTDNECDTNELYTRDEKYIINAYRNCSDTGRERIMEQVNFMHQNFPKKEQANQKSSTSKIG